MEKWLEGLEAALERQELKVPYRYSMGPTASRFFTEIRDNKKILGIRCPKCKVVYVPPRSTCGRCFAELNEWVEVKDQGTLQTFTRVHYRTPVHPAAAPFYYGVIKLDGADTGLPHMIRGIGAKEPSMGMRVQAVFKDDRAGNMLDILYFQPADEPVKERAPVKVPQKVKAAPKKAVVKKAVRKKAATKKPVKGKAKSGKK